MVWFLLAASLILFGCAVGCIVADCLLPRIPWLRRFIDSLPAQEEMLEEEETEEENAG